MLMNLRADGGLESHREYLRDEVETWLVDKQEEADVTFICSRVDSDNDDTVMLAAHQAVLAPVSSVLRDMFSEHSCSMVRNMIYITMDCDPQVCTYPRPRLRVITHVLGPSVNIVPDIQR